MERFSWHFAPHVGDRSGLLVLRRGQAKLQTECVVFDHLVCI